MDASGASPWSDVAQAIQASFAQAGIKLDIISGEQKQVITKLPRPHA